PQCVGLPLGDNLCGRVVPRIGTRKVAIFGIALIVLGSFGMATITPETVLWIVVLYVLVMGIGYGLAAIVLAVVLQSAVEKEMRGSAGSLTTLTRTMGKTIGVAVLGAVMFRAIGMDPSSGTVPSHLVVDGLHAVFICFALISVLSLLVVV